MLQVERGQLGAVADLLGQVLQLVVRHVEGHQLGQLADRGRQRSGVKGRNDWTDLSL